jgi:two-component system response regulator AtoC
MRLGATDFLCKPFEENELEMVIQKALKQHQLSQEVATLRAQLKEQSRYTMLFGHSHPMQEVRDLIERVSDTDVTVLIRGESGVGKELVARALHEQSLRKDKPFVKVNCAIQHKPGKFEFANHGTMFLDEIGDMSFPLQAKLLQALQDGEFSRLGGKADVHVDVRVITATNCDLESAVAAGKFREDLYFRLNVVTITIPPLRDRREEIPMLTDHFVKKYSVQYNKPFPGISADLSHLFLEYEWPGNVRQLENMIKRMVVLGSETPIITELQQPSSPLHHWPHATSASAPRPYAPPPQPVMPPPAVAVAAPVAVAAAPASIGVGSVSAMSVPAGASAASSVSLKDIARSAAREAERELILRMLTRTRWNRKEAAEILGISYKALLYKIKENGLDKAS